MSRVNKKPGFAFTKTKAQISCVADQSQYLRVCRLSGVSVVVCHSPCVYSFNHQYDKAGFIQVV